MLDAELLDDVAYTLYARCLDVLLVSRSFVRCVECRTEFSVPWIGQGLDALSSCPSCGWTTTASEFHKSFEHQDLLGMNAVDAFQAFVDGFERRARTPREKMIVIDRLVHEAHKPAKGAMVGNTVGRNLFEGRRHRIVATLDSLAYGDGSVADIESHMRWQESYVRRRRSTTPPDPCSKRSPIELSGL